MAITAIIVEFILIVVSLIASVVLSGFVFGTFSYYVPPAEVAAETASCSAAANSTVCQLVLANQGTKNVATTGQCSMSVSGPDHSGQVLGGGEVPAAGTLSGVECMVQGAAASAGSRVSGAIGLGNGGLAYFSGTVS